MGRPTARPCTAIGVSMYRNNQANSNKSACGRGVIGVDMLDISIYIYAC